MTAASTTVDERLGGTAAVLARARRVIGMAMAAWTLLVVVVCLVLVVFTVTGRRVEVVLSSSMEPAIPRGSAVFVEPVDEAAVAAIDVGDVIAFRSPGSDASIIHRVVERTDAQLGVLFTTAGDANSAPDARPVQPSQLTGIVAGVAPGIGSWLRPLLPPGGFVVLIGVPALLWMALALIDRSLAVAAAHSGPPSDVGL
jgi:signal peptidase